MSFSIFSSIPDFSHNTAVWQHDGSSSHPSSFGPRDLMTDADFGSLALLLLLILAAAHVLGECFARLRQPRVIGEILAGVLLGPSVLGRFAPAASTAIFAGITGRRAEHNDVLIFVYDLGLILLMFLSGAEMRGLLGRQDRKQVTWLATVGTGLPFLIVLALGPWLPLSRMIGAAQQRASLLLVVGIAVAVTSIPVISRIFLDLGIMRTRFARLVLAVAVIEDV